MLPVIIYLIGLDQDVYTYSNSTWREIRGEQEPKMLTIDPFGRLWSISPNWYANFLNDNNIWTDYNNGKTGISLAVDSSGTPYMVSSDFYLHRGTRQAWTLHNPKTPRCKVVAMDGEDNLWIIDLYGQIFFNVVGDQWIEYPSDGRAVNLVVSRNGDPYIINSANQIYRGKMGKWEIMVGGLAKDIAVDSNGTLWAVGLDYKIWYLDDNEVWRRYGGAKKGSQIVVL